MKTACQVRRARQEARNARAGQAGNAKRDQTATEQKRQEGRQGACLPPTS